MLVCKPHTTRSAVRIIATYMVAVPVAAGIVGRLSGFNTRVANTALRKRGQDRVNSC
jgi:hypothetical protein